MVSATLIFVATLLAFSQVITANNKLHLAPGYLTKDTVQLNLPYYNQNIKHSKEDWIVVFCKPGCGYCKQMSEEWAEVAEELKGVVKFGAVNIKTERPMYRAVRHQLTDGVPVVVHMVPSPETGHRTFVEYPGAYKAPEFRQWILKRINADKPSTSVRHEVDEDLYDD